MGRHAQPGPEQPEFVDLAAVSADDALLDVIGAHRAPDAGGSTAAPTGDPSVGELPDVSWAAPHLPSDLDVAGPDLFEVAVTPAPRPQPAPPMTARRVGPDPAVRDGAGRDRDPAAVLTDALLTWRERLTVGPTPVPPDIGQVAAVLFGTSARRGSLRSVIGIAAAIVVLFGGSAVAGARSARPGDLLWPVTQVVWADRADSLVAGDTARGAIHQAEDALVGGNTSEASSALAVASTVLPRVEPRDGRDKIQADLDALYAELDKADAPATTEPGVSSVAPPPATDPAAAVSSVRQSIRAATVSGRPDPAAPTSTAGGPPPRSGPQGTGTVPSTPGIPPIAPVTSTGPGLTPDTTGTTGGTTATSTASPPPPATGSTDPVPPATVPTTPATTEVTPTPTPPETSTPGTTDPLPTPTVEPTVVTSSTDTSTSSTSSTSSTETADTSTTASTDVTPEVTGTDTAGASIGVAGDTVTVPAG